MSAEDRIAQRWLAALKLAQPHLPHPVAAAIVAHAANSPIGDVLLQIEQAILRLEETELADLTGSEARMLIAILRQMSSEVGRLESRLVQLWGETSAPSHGD